MAAVVDTVAAGHTEVVRRAVVDTVAAGHTEVVRTVAAAVYKALAAGMLYRVPVRSEPALP